MLDADISQADPSGACSQLSAAGFQMLQLRGGVSGRNPCPELKGTCSVAQRYLSQVQ
jgi:hypothetical protein